MAATDIDTLENLLVKALADVELIRRAALNLVCRSAVTDCGDETVYMVHSLDMDALNEALALLDQPEPF